MPVAESAEHRLILTAYIGSLTDALAQTKVEKLSVSDSLLADLHSAGVTVVDELTRTPSELLSRRYALGLSGLSEIVVALRLLRAEDKTGSPMCKKRGHYAQLGTGLAVPAQIRSLPISALNLTPSARRAAFACKAATVGELCDVPLQEFAQHRGVAHRRVELVRNAIRRLASSEQAVSLSGGVDAALSFQSLLSQLIARLTVEQQHVVQTVCGIKGASHSLAAAGATLGLSRERARQLHSLACAALRADIDSLRALTRELERVCASDPQPVTIDRLVIRDRFFTGCQPRALQWTIQNLLAPSWDVVEASGVSGIVIVGQKSDFLRALRIAEKLVGQATEMRASVAATRATLAAALKYTPRLNLDIVWQLATMNARMLAGPFQAETLVGRKDQWRGLIVAAMYAKAGPITRAELIEAVRAQRASFDEESVFATAREVGLAIAQGVYCLPEFFPVPDPSLRTIAGECEQLVLTQDRQWHTAELAEAIGNPSTIIGRHVVSPERLVQIALAKHARRIHSVGRLVWVGGSNDSESVVCSTARLRVHELVEAELRGSDRPLTTDELRRRVSQNRGISRYFQIIPRGNVVRVGSNSWWIVGGRGRGNSSRTFTNECGPTTLQESRRPPNA